MTNALDEIIRQAAATHLADWSYDWRLFKAQLWQESRLKPNAISPAGAQGIAQVMPETWQEWSKKAGYPYASPFDPEASVNVGACYMDYQLNQWYWDRPDVDRYALALASYNAGLKNILEAQLLAGNASGYAEIIARLPDVTGSHSAETVDYVQKVFKFWIAQVLGGV